MTAARGAEVQPGIYRLRLPMPWVEAPVGNAWALAHDGGLVLVDTGVGGEGALARFERALADVGHQLADVHLIVCTHAHADHIGLAAALVAATGAPLWLDPAWDYIRPLGTEPEALWERRRQFMRRHGAAAESIEDFRRSTAGWNIVDGIAEPDRELGPGVSFETDHGRWLAHPTPGHDPAHVVFHQPERRLLLGGDLLIEGPALFFEYGFTPDPVADHLRSLAVGEGLEFDLCFPGHGRPIADPQPVFERSRAEVEELLGRTEAIVARDRSTTAAAIAVELLGADADKGAYVFRFTQNALAALDHLRLQGRVESVEGDGLVTWEPA
jgi:glyoxylase-like metal-dependent hydrolase (beta-lactamase superfamily II)